MKHLLLLLLSTFVGVSCTSAPVHKELGVRQPSSDAVTVAKVDAKTLNPEGQLWDASDVRLRDPNGPTILTLLQMSQDPDGYNKLNDLFLNHSVSMKTLPHGYAAGKGARVLGAPDEVEFFLQLIVKDLWRGKMFCDSTSPQNSQNQTHGYNRIRNNPFVDSSPIVPQGEFHAELVAPGDPRIPSVAGNISNAVILNYAHPVTTSEDPTNRVNNDLIEKALVTVPVYDVMVAVRGPNGPVYIGKTWWGKYDTASTDFTPTFTPNTTNLIAWYFLDFSAKTLVEQKEDSAFGWPVGQQELPTAPGNDCSGIIVPQ